VLLALGGSCLAVWKIRQADLREIDRKIEATAISFVAFKLTSPSCIRPRSSCRPRLIGCRAAFTGCRSGMAGEGACWP
jgi:hypothetical protein